MIDKILILAAGRGSRLIEHTEDKPKCMTELNGKTILSRTLYNCANLHIDDVAIVTGYKHQCLSSLNIKKIHNPEWLDSGVVYSLYKAKEWLEHSSAIIIYSDVIISHKDMDKISKCDADIIVAYDPNAVSLWCERFVDPLSDIESFKISPDNQIIEIGSKVINIDDVEGQFIGLIKVSSMGLSIILKHIESMSENQVRYIDTTSLLSHLIKNGVPIYGVPIDEKWMEIDNPSDIDYFENINFDGELTYGY